MTKIENFIVQHNEGLIRAAFILTGLILACGCAGAALETYALFFAQP